MRRLSAGVLALVTSAVLVALGVMSFQKGAFRSRPVVLPFEVFWCAKDDDCAVVKQIGCCPCSQGGGQAAVTRWRRDDLRRFLKRACDRDQVCVQVDVCRRGLAARCVKRRCTLMEADDS